MRIDQDGNVNLTYCTNIHAADGWHAVASNVRRYGPALKSRLSPADPFGLGLRLSARDAQELLEPGRLAHFRSFLADEGLYVALINGFPHGSFHGIPVKADVYAPDWRSDTRVAYTKDLITILAQLLPPGMEGGVSTAPLSYKPWMASAEEDAMEAITRNIVQVVETLVQTRRAHGRIIHLDIEPEPDCLLETTAETIGFFENWLLPMGGRMLAREAGVRLSDAQDLLREHVQVCFDCCHFAVEFEDPLVALQQFADAGVRIGRVQLSSAVDVALPANPAAAAELADRLRPFADTTYLHQVVERRAGTLTHYSDLGLALDTADGGGAREWRVHFHVPLFTSEYAGLGSTQAYVRTVLEAAERLQFTQHLEIETYTWDVLPGDLKIDLLESIRREYEWVLANYPAASVRRA